MGLGPQSLATTCHTTLFAFFPGFAPHGGGGLTRTCVNISGSRPNSPTLPENTVPSPGGMANLAKLPAQALEAAWVTWTGGSGVLDTQVDGTLGFIRR